MVIRALRESDLPGLEAIFLAQTDQPPPQAWGQRVASAIADSDGPIVARVAVGDDGAVLGYAVGEVRSWEFGSERAGWIFAIGVDPEHEGRGLGRLLLRDVSSAFAAKGISIVRTMVRRDDVSVLRFFRASGFATGPYTELELTLTP